jgi:phage terminase large subunit
MPRKIEQVPKEKQVSVNIQVNDVYKRVLSTDKSYILLLGGRASGKSYFLEDLIIMKLMGSQFARIAIMRYVRADLADSLIQGLKDKIDMYNLGSKVKIQVQPFKITYKKNTIVTKFFKETSSSRTAQLKSLKDFTDVFIEEFEEVTDRDAFRKLSDTILRGVAIRHPITKVVTGRIKSRIYMVSNPPTAGHWMVKEFLELHKTEYEGFSSAELKTTHKDDTEFIFSTYKDNLKHLDSEYISSFENRINTDTESYKVDVLGYVPDGKIGRIYKDWKQITDEEYEAMPCTEIVYGLDFGFSNDPTACVEMKKVGEDLYLKEILYEQELTNRDIYFKLRDKIPEISERLIYADSANPQNITELQNFGLDIYPATKGPDSINAGIQLLKQHRVFYTESSENLATEVLNYLWATNKLGERTNKPIDRYNHILDSCRYSLLSHYGADGGGGNFWGQVVESEKILA